LVEVINGKRSITGLYYNWLNFIAEDAGKAIYQKSVTTEYRNYSIKITLQCCKCKKVGVLRIHHKWELGMEGNTS